MVSIWIKKLNQNINSHFSLYGKLMVLFINNLSEFFKLKKQQRFMKLKSIKFLLQYDLTALKLQEEFSSVSSHSSL